MIAFADAGLRVALPTVQAYSVNRATRAAAWRQPAPAGGRRSSRLHRRLLTGGASSRITGLGAVVALTFAWSVSSCRLDQRDLIVGVSLGDAHAHRHLPGYRLSPSLVCGQQRTTPRSGGIWAALALARVCLPGPHRQCGQPACSPAAGLTRVVQPADAGAGCSRLLGADGDGSILRRGPEAPTRAARPACKGRSSSARWRSSCWAYSAGCCGCHSRPARFPDFARLLLDQPVA